VKTLSTSADLGRVGRQLGGAVLALLSLAACTKDPVFVDDAPGGAGSDSICKVDQDCQDESFCNGVESCDPGSKKANARGCVPSTGPVDCDDEIECTTDRCSDSKKACVFSAPDNDKDGFPDAACQDQNGESLGTDCDDDDAERFPGQVETCDELDRDEDCDTATFGSLDEDGDGAVSSACCNGDICGDDCDDQNIAIRPLQPEFCDELDNNCDGKRDNNTREIYWYVDNDGDGYGSPTEEPEKSCTIVAQASVAPTDCNDENATDSPEALERCDDGVDNNCNGLIDEGEDCGSPEGTPVCPVGRTACGGICADVEIDERFCGDCLTRCGESERCEDGTCEDAMVNTGSGGGSGTGGSGPGNGGAGAGNGGTSNTGGSSTGGSSSGGSVNEGATAILFRGECLPVCESATAGPDGIGVEDGTSCVIEDSSAFNRGLACTAESVPSMTLAEWNSATFAEIWSQDFDGNPVNDNTPWGFEGDFKYGESQAPDAPDAFKGANLAGAGLDAPYGSGLSRLTLPEFEVPARTTLPYLRYRYWYGLSPEDEVRIEIRTQAGGPWHQLEDVTGTLSHIQGDSRIWTQAILQLDVLSGRTIQLSFVLDSKGNSEEAPGFFIDKVQLARGQLNICGCQGFNDPPDTPEDDGSNDWSIEGGQWGIGPRNFVGPPAPHGEAPNVPGFAGTSLFAPYSAWPLAPKARLTSPTRMATSTSAEFFEWYSMHSGASMQLQIREAGGSWQNLGPALTGSTEASAWDAKRQAVFDNYAGKVVQLGFLFSNGGSSSPNQSLNPGYFIDEVVFP
jgi:Putative metal-binding motif/Stigma-specific protein, Stig1